MNLHTTYVSALGSSVDPDGEIIAVIRAEYDWLNAAVDRNIQALAPPPALLKSFKAVETAAEKEREPDAKRIAWDTVDYRRRYLEHLESDPARQHVKRLREKLENGQTIWLVCLEKDDTFCHRRLLAAHIKNETPSHWRELHEPVERETEPAEGLDAWL